MGNIASPELTDQLEFLTTHLPAPPARVLDAGCGRGALAGALTDLGHEVTAVDIDADAVAAARAAGVPAVRADLAEFDGGPFDAVVCSLSLHHVRRLERTLAHLAGLLDRHGVLVVDEFDWDSADPPTAAWFCDLAAVLDAAGLLGTGRDHPPVPDPLHRWRRHHGVDDPMHTGPELLRALAGEFEVVELLRVPYLHRYLGGWLGPDTAPTVVAALRATEALRVEQGALRPTGLRIVARRTPGTRR